MIFGNRDLTTGNVTPYDYSGDLSSIIGDSTSGQATNPLPIAAE